MKIYNAPRITTKGIVTESTRMIHPGTRDPKNPILLELETSGSIGFQL